MVPVSQTNKEIAKISKQIYIYIYSQEAVNILSPTE